MSKVNLIGADGAPFTTSLKRSRDLIASGKATLAVDAPKKVAAKKAPARKAAAKKAPAKVAAKRTYNTRALKAK